MAARDPRRSLPALALVAGLTVVPLAGCGGEGKDAIQNLPAPTTTPTLPTPTRSLRPSEQPEPTESATETQGPDETDAAAPTETVTVTESAEPAPTETATETATATATATLTETPTESPTAPPEEGEPADDEEGSPAWVWWLLGAVLVGAAVAIPLLVRARRRTAWQRDLAAGEADVAWLARQLIPELRHHPSVWTASNAARVAATEERLDGLAGHAPDDAGRARAAALRDAAREARERIDVVIATGSLYATNELDDVITRLEAALAAPR